MNLNDLLTNKEAAGVAPASLTQEQGMTFAIYQDEHFDKWLIVSGKPSDVGEFEFTEKQENNEDMVIKAPLTHHNCDLMRHYFPWMKPVKRTGYAYSFGVGDRLGLASQAHIRVLRDRGVLPVLAQQSIRELNLTGRTYTEVLDDAAWAVFEEGYRDGFGADGDHLKNPFEIDYAIKCGFLMLTLDCSEYIHNEVANYSDVQLQEAYDQLALDLRMRIEKDYLDQSFEVSKSVSVSFDRKNLMETVLIFYDAINFATDMYHRFVLPNDLDFEISIDETIVPTTPENHYFIASELNKRKIVVETMAPKFHGEFQKGIDYRGDLEQFKREYVVHEAIAEKFGYRLSIHSGSDKFMVYPTIGQVSSRGWHVKTAGTNWLEALRVIAKNNPALMLEIYEFALENLDTAKAYYHIDATKDNAIAMSEVNQTTVAKLLDDDMSRQVLHVTFGLILRHQENGQAVLKDGIYACLKEHYDDYAQYLMSHIGKHVTLLDK